MNFFKRIFDLLGARALTVWIVGGFIFYYLTMAVWSEEAFAKFIIAISSNNLARAVYLIFFVNVTIRVIRACWRVRKSWVRLILRLPLYAGILIFLFASFGSVNSRQSKWLLIGDGDVINLPWESGPLRVVRIDPALKSDLLRVDDSIIFDYEPFVNVVDMTGKVYRVGAFPPKRVKSSYMHILNFGIAPGVELWKDGRLLSRGYVALRLLPFGRVDSFELSVLPYYKFYIHILPNKTIKKGNESARNYNIEKPLYQLEVVRGDRTVFTGTSSDSLSFENITMKFFKPTFWVQLEVVRDPFYLWFVTGVILSLAGILLLLLDWIIWGIFKRTGSK